MQNKFLKPKNIEERKEEILQRNAKIYNVFSNGLKRIKEDYKNKCYQNEEERVLLVMFSETNSINEFETTYAIQFHYKGVLLFECYYESEYDWHNIEHFSNIFFKAENNKSEEVSKIAKINFLKKYFSNETN